MKTKKQYESPELNWINVWSKDVLSSSDEIEEDFGENDGEWM